MDTLFGGLRRHGIQRYTHIGNNGKLGLECCMLKTHNYRLKGTVGSITCLLCAVEDVNHLVLQCPFIQIERNHLLDEIHTIKMMWVK